MIKKYLMVMMLPCVISLAMQENPDKRFEKAELVVVYDSNNVLVKDTTATLRWIKSPECRIFFNEKSVSQKVHSALQIMAKKIDTHISERCTSPREGSHSFMLFVNKEHWNNIKKIVPLSSILYAPQKMVNVTVVCSADQVSVTSQDQKTFRWTQLGEPQFFLNEREIPRYDQDALSLFSHDPGYLTALSSYNRRLKAIAAKVKEAIPEHHNLQESFSIELEKDDWSYIACCIKYPLTPVENLDNIDQD